ncbi:YdcF family protein [Pseudomonas sp. F1_0610]|uniref:YdcF family protein n=1 Tax=Pseudomonas sp. F1_0610 TaxID=3114284 RepID=UPI0039C15E43
MPFRYILKQFLLPPGCFILLLIAAFVFRKRFPRLSAASFMLSIIGLWVMSMPILTEKLGQHLENQPALAKSEWARLADKADAIVILGAGREVENPAWGYTDQVSLHASQRVRFAAHLAKVSGLPVLTTGGLHFGTKPPSEAKLMADMLKADFNIDAKWLEEKSTTTWENATMSADILRSQGIQRIVLVTQAWHMQRARWSFEAQGFEVIPAPTSFYGVANMRPAGGYLPEAHAFWQNTQLINEWVGLIAYPLAYKTQENN